MPKIESEKIYCLYIDRARGRRLRAKSNRYARTQKSSNSLIRFHCSNSCFLLETGIAGHERLLLAKWHPKFEKKLRKRPFFDSADRHEKLYGRSRLYASAQGRHETGGVLSLFSSLSFDISIKNSMQRWYSDFQGLFCVKIRKMAQGSNDLSTLPLSFLVPPLTSTKSGYSFRKKILPCPPYKKVCNVKQLFAPCNHFMERPPSRVAVIKHVTY